MADDSKAGRRRRALLVLGVPALVVVLATSLLVPTLDDADLASASDRVTPTPSVTPTPDPDEQARIDELELEAAIGKYLAEREGNYSVSVIEVGGAERTISIDGERRVDAASTIKLFYAYALLLDIEAGLLSLDTMLSSGVAIGDCLRVMIEVSDNECARDIRLRVGMTRINELLAATGYPNTFIVLDGAGEYETKRISTDDIALLLARLEQGTILGEASTALLKSHLLAQVWRSRIASSVPPGIVVGTKSGQLLLPSGMVEGDTGIVYGETSTYTIAIMGTDGGAGNVVKTISSIVYRHLQGRLSYRASYPVKQFTTVQETAFRSHPDGGYVISYVPASTPVQVDFSSRLWMLVIIDGQKGYIDLAHLTLRPSFLWAVE